MKSIVDGCFERLVDDIDAFGGRVDKIIGDAIVALFGAPVVHEDDAERAVRAALRMQQTVCSRYRAARASTSRCASASTPARCWSGPLRSGGDYTALGDAVNIAQRLQVAAPPGGVLVGPATHAATRGRHPLRAGRPAPRPRPRGAGRGLARPRADRCRRACGPGASAPRSSAAAPSASC